MGRLYWGRISILVFAVVIVVACGRPTSLPEGTRELVRAVNGTLLGKRCVETAVRSSVGTCYRRSARRDVDAHRYGGIDYEKDYRILSLSSRRSDACCQGFPPWFCQFLCSAPGDNTSFPLTLRRADPDQPLGTEVDFGSLPVRAGQSSPFPTALVKVSNTTRRTLRVHSITAHLRDGVCEGNRPTAACSVAVDATSGFRQSSDGGTVVTPGCETLRIITADSSVTYLEFPPGASCGLQVKFDPFGRAMDLAEESAWVVFDYGDADGRHGFHEVTLLGRSTLLAAPTPTPRAAYSLGGDLLLIGGPQRCASSLPERPATVSVIYHATLSCPAGDTPSLANPGCEAAGGVTLSRTVSGQASYLSCCMRHARNPRHWTWTLPGLMRIVCTPR